MSSLVVTNTFVAGTTILSGAMNTNFDDIETYINNRNSGTAEWERVLATNASSVPAVFNNGAGTNDILNAQDNGANVFRVTDGGNIIPGSAALATTATDGFIYIETCAGTPTGVPTAFTGRVATIFDTTNNILYVYDGGWIANNAPSVDNSTIELNAGILRVKDAGITAAKLASNLALPGIITIPAQPSFLAYNSSQDNNVTGDGTLAAIEFDTEIFDKGSNFASNTFTAPVTGIYLLSTTVGLLGAIAASSETLVVEIITSNRTYSSVIGNGSADTLADSIRLAFTTLADMDAGDTASVSVLCNGGSKTVDIAGSGATSLLTWFSGCLVN